MKEYFIWLAKFSTLVVAFLIVIPASLLIFMLAAKTAVDQSVPVKGKAVAVVEVEGIIMDSKEILKRLHEQVRNKHIEGVVLRVNSPGGAVGPSQEIYEAVKALTSLKPIVVSMSGVAASGGLYASLGASRVLAQPGTITGSIGVLLQIGNFQEIANKVGFKMVTIKSGKLKDAGNAFRAMKPEEEQYLQKTVADTHEQFITAVAESRGIDIDKVQEFADGRILLGEQAKALGLIDGYGDVYEASRQVFDILGKPLPEGKYPQLFYAEDKFEQFRELFQMGVRWFFPVRGQGNLELMYLMH